MELIAFLKGCLDISVPHNIFLYSIYYLLLHLGFEKFLNAHKDQKSLTTTPNLDLLLQQANEALQIDLPNLLSKEDDKKHIATYKSFLNTLTDNLKKSPQVNPLYARTPNIEAAFSFLPKLIEDTCNKNGEYTKLNPLVCQELASRLLEGVWGIIPQGPLDSIKQEIQSSATRLRLVHKDTSEILKIVRKLATAMEEQGLLPPKVAYENYFKAVSRRREEELLRLGHYAGLPAIDTRLAKTGEKARWATEVIEESIQKGEKAVISGESGSGKTFTFLKLFETFKEKYLKDESPYIPLFVELYMLKYYNFCELLNGTYLNAKIDDHRYERDKSRYIVFLDGLNESPNPEQAFKDIKTLSSISFISTQRAYDFLQKASFGPTFQIEALDPQQVIDYLCNFKGKFPSRMEAEEFYYKRLDESLKEQVRRPVTLFFLATLYDETGTIPHNLGDLLSRFVDFVCERRLGDVSVQISESIAPRYKEEVLPVVAFRMCQNRERTLTRENLKEIINNEFGQAVDFYDFETHTSRRYWLLKEKKGEREKYFEFTLELLRDYFAARYMVAAGFSLRVSKLLELVFPEDGRQADPTFSSVSEILCGIVSEPEAVEIIESILPKDPYLAASCFARSSITSLQEDLLWKVSAKIDSNDPRYFPSINKIVQFRKKALELYRSNGKENDPSYGRCQMNLGIALRNKLDHDGAIEAYRKALKVYEENQMQNHPSYGRCQMNLGSALSDKLDYDGAIEAYRKALKVYEEN
ncbi:MAG TPA: tetratricopeptide repeat protein, partial [Candidatus Hypogeohydataceae bacterium YC40]